MGKVAITALGALLGGTGTLCYRGLIEDHPPTKFLLGQMNGKYKLTEDDSKFEERAKLYDRKSELYVPGYGRKPEPFASSIKDSEKIQSITGSELRSMCKSMKRWGGHGTKFLKVAHWVRFRYWCVEAISS